VFDPQGKTIADALHRSATGASRTCGRANTSSRSRDDEAAAAKALAAEVADKLLANPVIESYRIEVDQ
jgi:phosphoribosylformylglycinamidine (FGAM) synthase PurS component